MKNTPIWVVASALLGVFFVASPVFAQSAGPSGYQISNQPDNTGSMSWATFNGTFVLATSTTGFQVTPSTLNIQVDNNNVTVTWPSIQIRYRPDTGCSLSPTYTFNVPTQIDGARVGTHDVWLDIEGASAATSGVKCIEVVGVGPSTYPGGGSVRSNLAGTLPFYYLFATGTPFPAGTIAAYQGTATSSPLFGTATSTGSCDGVQNDVVWVACSVGAYLFIPSPVILNQWANLPSVISQRFPFSWLYGLQVMVTGTAASSSANMIAPGIDFGSVDPATSTPFGPILPTFTFLSSTTIQKYMPAGTWATFYFLMQMALWLLLLAYVVHWVNNRSTHV